MCVKKNHISLLVHGEKMLEHIKCLAYSRNSVGLGPVLFRFSQGCNDLFMLYFSTSQPVSGALENYSL